MPDDEVIEDGEEESPGPRGIWSGTLTFGLVSIPVELFSATRSVRPRLRMLTEDGRALRRAYFAKESEREVKGDAIERGFELDDGRFVVVTEEELEAVEPERSRDIHLRRFVPKDSISPAYFKRSYLLAPAGESTRSYAVLADTMDRSARAGIATFVMRGKEYLVAIFAERGILRATTLRFADELRSRSTIGLPDAPDVAAATKKKLLAAVKKSEAKKLPKGLLEDTRAAELEALARDKHARGEDVVQAPEELASEPEGEEPSDLVALLKQRLAAGKGGGGDDLEARSKDELYERAKELDIEGRSKMSKDQLIRSIRAAEAA